MKIEKSKDWWMNMANQEGDAECSAGSIVTCHESDMPQIITAYVEDVDGIQFYNHWTYEGFDADDPTRKTLPETKYVRKDLYDKLANGDLFYSRLHTRKQLEKLKRDMRNPVQAGGSTEDWYRNGYDVGWNAGIDAVIKSALRVGVDAKEVVLEAFENAQQCMRLNGWHNKELTSPAFQAVYDEFTRGLALLSQAQGDK